MRAIGGLTIYCNRRIIFLKTWYDLHLQCDDLYPQVVCNVETRLDHSVLDNEVTISSYCLLSLDVVEYCCTLGMICHTMSQCTDPENLENLGFILYNGDSNRVCLYALYSPHSATHQMSLYKWFLCHIWESAKRYIVSVPCQVIILGLCNNYIWVIIVPNMRICQKAVSVRVR